MEFRSPDAEDRYAALVGVAAKSVVGLDFDGTLSPIVENPEAAHIHPDAGAALADLADVVAAVAVITGRPARQALALGGLDEVGNSIGEAGKELHLFGQYGFERWSSTNRRIVSPRPPHGLSTFLGRLPGMLRRVRRRGGVRGGQGAGGRRTHPAAGGPRRRLRPAAAGAHRARRGARARWSSPAAR